MLSMTTFKFLFRSDASNRFASSRVEFHPARCRSLNVSVAEGRKIDHPNPSQMARVSSSCSEYSVFPQPLIRLRLPPRCEAVTSPCGTSVLQIGAVETPDCLDVLVFPLCLLVRVFHPKNTTCHFSLSSWCCRNSQPTCSWANRLPERKSSRAGSARSPSQSHRVDAGGSPSHG